MKKRRRTRTTLGKPIGFERCPSQQGSDSWRELPTSNCAAGSPNGNIPANLSLRWSVDEALRIRWIGLLFFFSFETVLPRGALKSTSDGLPARAARPHKNLL